MIELYPHQIEAVRKLGNGKVLKGGVGTGKSITAMAYFYNRVCEGHMPLDGSPFEPQSLSEPRDLFVITTARKRDDLDWEGEAARFAISTDRDKSWGGVKLTVDSWNNVVKYKDVEGAFFIFDEQRLVGSGAWVKAFLEIAKKNRWIVLSATPGDVWMDYVPIFIANGLFKNRTDFIRKHVVYSNYTKFPKIDRYVDTAPLYRARKRLVVDMPYARSTVRKIHTTYTRYDQAMYDRVWKDRWHIYEDRPIKEVGELFQVIRKVVNTDPSRLDAVREILKTMPRVIIFYNFNYELEMLRTLSDIRLVKEWNGQKHEPVPDTDEWVYLVQYTAGSEAWNCVTTDTMIFYSLNYSYKVMEQSKGRIDRLNTPYRDLHYYILRSNSQIDKAIDSALKQKKNFNEKDFVR